MMRENFRDAIIDELHERTGYCGHCGTRKCPERKLWSNLPEKMKTDDVLAAIFTVLSLPSTDEKSSR